MEVENSLASAFGPAMAQLSLSETNPPLNRGSVIQFMDGEDEEGTGALRQIRGVKQGCFEEEEVRIAVRFFVAA